MSFFDKQSQTAIVNAIREAESRTSAEIRVHVGKAVKTDALTEAENMFRKLGMHKTAERNGVLIFISPKSHAFAIVGDEAIHRHAGEAFWQGVRDRMSAHFEAGRFTEGVERAIAETGSELAKYFPRTSADVNELPDDVSSHD